MADHMFVDLWRNTPKFGIILNVDLVLYAARSLVFRKHLLVNHVGFELTQQILHDYMSFLSIILEIPVHCTA